MRTSHMPRALNSARKENDTSVHVDERAQWHVFGEVSMNTSICIGVYHSDKRVTQLLQVLKRPKTRYNAMKRRERQNWPRAPKATRLLH